MFNFNGMKNEEIIELLKLKIDFLEKENFILKSEIKNNKIDKETQTLSIIDDLNDHKNEEDVVSYEGTSIIDMIKETSTSYLSSSGYTYDERTGLYEHSSGFYYDPTNKLLYDPKNGFYYSFDPETQQYTYHSKDDEDMLQAKQQEMIWSRGYQHKPPTTLSSEDCHEGDIPNLAPCIRIICTDTADLSIITCTGGSIGTDPSKDPTVLIHGPKNELVTLPISYNTSNKTYSINTDVTNKSMLVTVDDVLLTKDNTPLRHLSKVVFCAMSYVVHIHQDYDTCDGCEPGQLKALLNNATLESSKSESFLVKRSRMTITNQLKAKYGLRGSKSYKGYHKMDKVQPKYVDRAQLRRLKEKEEDDKIEKKKKGSNAAFNMMSKMGWMPGTSLGKSGDGILEPVDAYQRTDVRAGIGCDHNTCVKTDVDYKTMRKMKMMSKMQSRYDSLCKE